MAAALASLTACTTVGPDYRLPASAAARRDAAQGAFIGAQGPAVALAPVAPHWWRLYDDAALDALVQQALQANASLREAAAHLRHALAVVDAVDAERGPHAGAEVMARRAQESGEAYLLPEQLPIVNEGDVGLQVSYEFDLFGQLARGEEAAAANAQASQAALELARVTVAAATVRAYVQGCTADVEQQAARHALDLQLRAVDVARRLNQAGRGQPADIARAQAQADALRANLPRFDAARDAAHYRLATLLGRTPQEMRDTMPSCSRLPRLAQPIPVGDGAALLKRRPDVRQAERQLAAATARIGVATGDLYPHISLGASAGLTGILEHLGEGRTQRWALGPLITWSLPDSGARARVKVAEADAEASLARFDGVVLNALRETETALSRYAHDLQRQADLRAAHEQAASVAQQNRRLYEAGRTPYLSSLDADRSLASLDEALVSASGQVAQDQVDLFLALGGGWEP